MKPLSVHEILFFENQDLQVVKVDFFDKAVLTEPGFIMPLKFF